MNARFSEIWSEALSAQGSMKPARLSPRSALLVILALNLVLWAGLAALLVLI